MTELIIFLLLALAVWFVSDSMKAREVAHAAARKACEAAGVQFLDDTVSQARIGLGRDTEGRAIIERHFSFEFSPSGDNRERGSVRLRGHCVQEVNLARLWLIE